MVSKFNCKTKAFLYHILLASLESSVLRESGTHNKTCLAGWKNSALMGWTVVQDISEYICSEFCLVVQSITVNDSHSDKSISLQFQAMSPPRFFYPWNSPGKNTEVGCHCLFWLSQPGIEAGSPALQLEKPYNSVSVCVFIDLLVYVPWTVLWLESVLKSCKVKSLSRVRLFATLWTVARQAPPSMGFSRQEYWSGLSFH